VSVTVHACSPNAIDTTPREVPYWESIWHEAPTVSVAVDAMSEQ
jgi:hypothetical protein